MESSPSPEGQPSEVEVTVDARLFDDLPPAVPQRLGVILESSRTDIETMLSAFQASHEWQIKRIKALPKLEQNFLAGQLLYHQHYVSACKEMRAINRQRRTSKAIKLHIPKD